MVTLCESKNFSLVQISIDNRFLVRNICLRARRRSEMSLAGSVRELTNLDHRHMIIPLPYFPVHPPPTTGTSITTNAWALLQKKADLAMSAIWDNDWITPVSLLASMTDTSTVLSHNAASRSSNFTSPVLGSTPISVCSEKKINKPCKSSKPVKIALSPLEEMSYISFIPFYLRY